MSEAEMNACLRRRLGCTVSMRTNGLKANGQRLASQMSDPQKAEHWQTARTWAEDYGDDYAEGVLPPTIEGRHYQHVCRNVSAGTLNVALLALQTPQLQATCSSTLGLARATFLGVIIIK